MDEMDWDPTDVPPRRPTQQPQPYQHDPLSYHHSRHTPLLNTRLSHIHHGQQSACPAMRHLANRSSAHYDPVHASADLGNTYQQWHTQFHSHGHPLPHQQHHQHTQRSTSSPLSFYGSQDPSHPVPYAFQGHLNYQGNSTSNSNPNPNAGSHLNPNPPFLVPNLSGRHSQPALQPVQPLPETAIPTHFSPSSSLGTVPVATGTTGSPFSFAPAAPPPAPTSAGPSTEGSTMQVNSNAGQSQNQSSHPGTGRNQTGSFIHFDARPPASISPQPNSFSSASSLGPAAAASYIAHRTAAATALSSLSFPGPPRPHTMTAAPPESQTERRRVGSSHRRQQQRANPSPRVYPPQPLPLNGAEYSAHVDDVRASQIIRGSLRTKIVASPEALRSLESVSVSELPENEKVCVICYNEFGAESPEGIREAPLRLPNCKHVFGDHCIKKWFEDSDSCPYCRDKLPSETRVVAPPNSIGAAYLRGLVGAHGRSGSSARVHHTGGGSRPGPLHSMGNAASSGSQQQAQERRSPPWDGEQSHRRQRPRHGTSEPARHEPQWASDQGGGPSTSAEAATSLRAAPEQAVGRGMVGGRRQAGTGPSGPSATQGSGDLGSSVADAGGGYRPYSATGGRMNNNGEAQVATARDGPEGLANFMTFHDSGQARLVEPATHWVPPPSWFQ